MTAIHSSQQLGEAVRVARKQLALTQPQLALAAGVGIRFIVDLEAGKPSVRLEQVLRVIDA
jgi:HTH-type transcriptional regulator / antitoxin HipB